MPVRSKRKDQTERDQSPKTLMATRAEVGSASLGGVIFKPSPPTPSGERNEIGRKNADPCGRMRACADTTTNIKPLFFLVPLHTRALFC